MTRQLVHYITIDRGFNINNASITLTLPRKITESTELSLGLKEIAFLNSGDQQIRLSIGCLRSLYIHVDVVDKGYSMHNNMPSDILKVVPLECETIDQLYRITYTTPEMRKLRSLAQLKQNPDGSYQTILTITDADGYSISMHNMQMTLTLELHVMLQE